MDLNYKNFNPLNIRKSDADWLGKVGNNKGFEVFSKPEYGYRAAAKNLYTSNTKYNNKSVRDLITRWAPPGDGNNTPAYVDKVAKDLGVDPDADLGNLESNPALTKKLLKSMTEVEGRNNKFTDQMIDSGVAMANGKDPKDVDFAKLETDGETLVYKDKIIKDAEVAKAEDAALKKKALKAGARAKQKNLFNLSTENWLSTVDSPTYRWTFYITNSKIFNDPSLLEGSDTAAINNNNAKIIAQTGVTTEFAMDNFAMIQRVVPGMEHGNTTPGVIQFDLMEPLGFTFLDRILKVGKSLGNPYSLPSQHYVLKLEFLGRDFETGGSVKYPNAFFYPIKINQVRSQTGPEGTRYNIIAFSMIKQAQVESITTVDLLIPKVNTVQAFAEGLVTAFNKAELNKLHPNEVKNGVKPPKEIEILFDKTSDISGILAQDTKSGEQIGDFSLKLKAWGSTANADKGAGMANAMDDADVREASINASTALGPEIKRQIERNCPAWAAYVKKVNEETGITLSIIVDLDIKFGIRDEKTGQLEHKKITFKIGIYTDSTGASMNKKKDIERLQNQAFQKQRLKNLSICKSYSYLYSGMNTEVLNYSLDIEQLYVTSRIPLDGVYHSEGRQQYTSSNPTKATKYLEDTDYNPMTDYIDLVQYVDKPLGVEEQQKNENDNSDTLYAQRLGAIAMRSADAINFNIEIKGDPFWQGNTFRAHVQGTDKSPLPSTDSLMITLLNYNPNPDDLLEKQVRGPVDLVSTGVYKITSIESRFQSGRFTQNLIGFKDPLTNPGLVLNQLIQITDGSAPAPTSENKYVGTPMKEKAVNSTFFDGGT
jgi:hypothetical protein